MDQREIHIGKHFWTARTFGTGDHLLIALHGFGEASSNYDIWEEAMKNDFTLFAVDLPYHGQTDGWQSGVIGPEDIVDLIEFIKADQASDIFSLAGHSLGARMLMATWQRLPAKPVYTWLLAPDGLATRRVGLINRLPLWARKGISSSIDRGYSFWMQLAVLLHRFGLLDIFSLRYMRHHLSDERKRHRLMGTWLMLPHFPVDRAQLLHTVRQGGTGIQLVVGKKDALIDWEGIADWLKKWPASNFYELNAGHNLINQQVAQLIRSVTMNKSRG